MVWYIIFVLLLLCDPSLVSSTLIIIPITIDSKKGEYIVCLILNILVCIFKGNILILIMNIILLFVLAYKIKPLTEFDL